MLPVILPSLIEYIYGLVKRVYASCAATKFRRAVDSGEIWGRRKERKGETADVARCVRSGATRALSPIPKKGRVVVRRSSDRIGRCSTQHKPLASQWPFTLSLHPTSLCRSLSSSILLILICSLDDATNTVRLTRNRPASPSTLHPHTRRSIRRYLRPYSPLTRY